jgi:hypothetical protein
MFEATKERTNQLLKSLEIINGLMPNRPMNEIVALIDAKICIEKDITNNIKFLEDQGETL